MLGMLNVVTTLKASDHNHQRWNEKGDPNVRGDDESKNNEQRVKQRAHECGESLSKRHGFVSFVWWARL
jgi:hypothetical protein